MDDERRREREVRSRYHEPRRRERNAEGRRPRPCFKLVHFHVGSQVPDISTIKRAVREAARYYAKLCKLGHELGYLDVGGGLGVDDDGSRSDFDSSTNYSLQEYANDVVWN